MNQTKGGLFCKTNIINASKIFKKTIFKIFKIFEYSKVQFIEGAFCLVGIGAQARYVARYGVRYGLR